MMFLLLLILCNSSMHCSAQTGSKSSKLVVTPQNEVEVLRLVVSSLPNRVNVGRVSGAGQFTKRVKYLMDINCKGTLPYRCDPNLKYRTRSGLCNNLENPEWGSASSKFSRFIDAAYADGRSIPRGGFESAQGHCDTGGRNRAKSKSSCVHKPDALLPNPRYVSTNFHIDRDEPSQTATAMIVFFSQLVAHDIVMTPENDVPVDCCKANPGDPGTDQCFSIHIPNCGDPHFPRKHCLSFRRSIAFCGGHTQNPREQMTAITSYIDASNVYGSNPVATEDLRQKQDRGFLRVSGSSLLPFIPDPNTEERPGGKVEVAGDERADIVPGLSSMHTLFMREHNRIAKILKASYGLRGETLFEETRRIVIAQMQHIVFGEFATMLLGAAAATDFLLAPDASKDRYDNKVDPTIRASVGIAAFRFGHSMLQGKVLQYGVRSHSKTFQSSLLESFFNHTLYFRGDGVGVEEILMGQVLQPAQKADKIFANDVTDKLLQKPNGDQASDLVARNIQRGRDHGLPGYNEFREFCGMQRACSWSSAPAELSAAKWKMLSNLYNEPSDVDLFAAGIAEEPYKDSLLGRTFTCLIAGQFNRMKFGDRFFFTFPESPYPFTNAQIAAVSKRSLADILCDNTAMTVVRKNVFSLNSPVNYACGRHQRLNLEPFASYGGR